jgi:hypothetical protein
MEIGTAIFLSALIISGVLLYVFSRDRIRWGRLFGRLALVLIATICLIGGGLYGWYLWEGRRAAIHSLDGVSLGESESDVIFKKGKVQKTCLMDGTKNIRLIEFSQKLPTKEKVTMVETRDGVAKRIVLLGDLGFSNLDGRNSVFETDTVDDVRKKWGQEDFIRSIDESSRLYVYRDYNLAVGLKNNQVEAIIIFDPSYYYKRETAQTKRTSECHDENGNLVK